MSDEKNVGPDVDTVMPNVQAESEVDEQQIFHEKRLEFLKSFNLSSSYKWKYLTDDFVQNIDSQRKSSLKKVIEEPEAIDDLFYEVVYSAKYHQDRLSIDQLCGFLTEGAQLARSDDYYFKFISILNTFKTDNQLELLLKGFKEMDYMFLGKYLVDDKLLVKMDVIKDYVRNKNDYILSNFVEQRKYNLIFESSEGFAKVQALLLQAINSDDSYFQVAYTVNAIDRLIGHFSLDPTRVLDTVLDIFINSILGNYRFCIDFLKKSQWWPKYNESDNSTLFNLNKGGNKEAAVLLGQKLNFYYMSKKDFPETLKALLAMLIKEGFVSFGDIIKYIGPDETAMKNLEEKVAKQIDDEIFKASASALALSGPLADDDEDDSNHKPKSRVVKSDRDNLNMSDGNALNQKLQLLKALLAVGLYWPSIYMLTKYPFLVHADKEIVPMILRLFHTIIDPLKDKVSILSPEDITELRAEKKTAFARKAPQEEVEFEDFEYQIIEVFRPLHNSHTNKKFVYFYHEWEEGLPTANNYEDLFKYSAELLPFVGANLGEDLQLVALLARFGVDDLERFEDAANYDEKLNLWFEYFRKFIFPASTVVVENSVTTHDIYDLLKKFPLQWRYNLYGELVNVLSKQNDTVRLHYSKAEKQTKNVLKRITTENVKPMMRRFAKISFSNPLPSFSVIVTQVESYDNLSNLMVDAARYFTDYAWDVLPYVLLMRLTARRNAVQSDGMNEALWLQSLATFIAKLGKNYASMNLTPILTYIIKSLHQNNLIGLTILREIVNQMGGIQQSSNLSATQIKLLNSGESLQRSINKVIFDTREKCTKPATRLLSQLINSNQLSELFILLCDFHKDLINKSDEDSHYKVLSNQSDEITSVLHTFIELINYFLGNDQEKFEIHIVGLSDLVETYRVETAWAFELWRKNIALENIGEIKFADVDFEYLDKTLYVSFWNLSLYDINYDESIYKHEKERLTDANASLSDQLARTRRERLTSEIRKKEDTLKTDFRFNEQLINQIPLDNEKHKSHSEAIMKAIEELRQGWFKGDEPTPSEIESLFQDCIIPRAIHSETDAIYTGKFITTLFNNEINNKIIDLFLKSEIIDSLIYTITPLEAENLGFFLAELFKDYEDLRNKEGLSNSVKALIYGWHQKALASIKVNIESENYMSRRNAFTLLKNLIDVYPIVEDHAEEIIESIQKVSSSESRNDLKLASDAILAHIKSRSKKWIHLWEFYDLPEDQKQQVIDARTALLKEREDEKLEAKRAELLRQKVQREAEIASRAQSRAASRAANYPESRPDSRAQMDNDANSEIRLRPRLQDVKDKDGDISMLDDSDKKDESEMEKENVIETEEQVETDSKNEEKIDVKKEDNTAKSPNVNEVMFTDDAIANTTDFTTKDKVEADTKTSPFESSNPAISDINTSDHEISTPADKSTDTYIPKPVDKTERSEATTDRRKTAFKDVTAIVTSESPAPRMTTAEAFEKLKTITWDVQEGRASKLREDLNDETTDRELIQASESPGSFQQELETILIGYAKRIVGSQSPAFTEFSFNIKEKVKKFPIPESPYRARPYGSESKKIRPPKRPLPSQEAVSGFTNQPNQKWGLDNKTIENRPLIKPLPLGPSGQGARRQYNQGYRQSSSSGSEISYTPPVQARPRPSRPAQGLIPPPPPPPPPPPSTADSRTENQNKRFQRSPAPSNYNQIYRTSHTRR